MTISAFFVHTATVRTYLGENATGPSLAPARSNACFIEDARDLVASGSGEQVASTAKLFASRSVASRYTVGSEVSSSAIPGRVARVIQVHIRDSGLLGLPDHVEVVLQ